MMEDSSDHAALLVDRYKRRFLQLTEISQLPGFPVNILRDIDFQSRIYNEIFSPASLDYPPPERYQLRALKALLAAIESSVLDPEEDEISDDLMLRLTSLMALPSTSDTAAAQQKSYVSYSVPHPLKDQRETDSTITLLESRSIISSHGATGLRTWEAALHLGSYLTTQIGSKLIKDKKVLELGAGTGFISILCAKYLDASLVLATDGDEAVIEDINVNISLNNLLSINRIKSRVLKWGQSLLRETPTVGSQVWDIVLGADITYDISAFDPLISSLVDLFRLNTHIRVLIAATVRNEATLNQFLVKCERNGFLVEDIEYSPDISSQSGFFHPTSPPIRILAISSTKPLPDPFAA